MPDERTIEELISAALFPYEYGRDTEVWVSNYEGMRVADRFRAYAERAKVSEEAISELARRLAQYEEALRAARPYVDESTLPPGSQIETTEESWERSAALLARIDALLGRAALREGNADA
jgi:hypothetical protein